MNSRDDIAIYALSQYEVDMTIKVETGIPIPPASRGAKPVYPFGVMGIDESFTVPAETADKAAAAARSFKNRCPGWDYAFRRMEDGTARIWRTA